MQVCLLVAFALCALWLPNFELELLVEGLPYHLTKEGLREQLVLLLDCCYLAEQLLEDEHFLQEL